MRMLFLALHSLRGENYKNRILVKEMMNKNSRYFIIISLFLLSPALTLRLVKLRNYFETFFVRIMSQFILQQGLVEIISFRTKGMRMRIFNEKFFDKMPRFCFFSYKAEYLINLIRDNIPILIFLIFVGRFIFFLYPREILIIILVIINFFFNHKLYYFLFWI